MNTRNALGLAAFLAGAAGMGMGASIGPSVYPEPFCTCDQRGLPPAGMTRRGRCKRCHNRVRS